MIETNKKPPSEKRKKFQDIYIDMVVHTKPLMKIIDDYKILIRMNLNRLTDEEFIDLIEKEETIDGFHSVHQWYDFIEFHKYVKGKK